MDISVILPVYNEEDNLEMLYQQLIDVLDSNGKSYEIIFVNDGSTDRSQKVIENIAAKDENVKYIEFQSNFQKSAALSAGFRKAAGEIIITLDSDLQDDPNEIPKFLDAIKDKDIVVGWRHKRNDSFAKKAASKIFNFLVRAMTGVKIHDSDCNFRAIRKSVVENIRLYGGLYRYIPSIASNKGFRLGEIKVRHNRRKHGKSKYGAGRLVTGMFDLVTVSFLLSFTRKPLHFFGIGGSLVAFVGFLMGGYLAYVRLALGQNIGNRPLLLLAILLMVLGIQFVSIGLLGEMISSNSKEDDYIVRKEI